MHRPQRVLIASCLIATLLSTPSTAFAAQTTTYGATKCTVTAKAPTLNTAKQVTGSLTITCTALTVVTVDTLVVELDGTVEQVVTGTTKTASVSVPKNGTVTVSSVTAKCTNTETGNEEYASKARIIISGSAAWSAWDRTVPANDSYAC